MLLLDFEFIIGSDANERISGVIPRGTRQTEREALQRAKDTHTEREVSLSIISSTREQEKEGGRGRVRIKLIIRILIKKKIFHLETIQSLIRSERKERDDSRAKETLRRRRDRRPRTVEEGGVRREEEKREKAFRV